MRNKQVLSRRGLLIGLSVLLMLATFLVPVVRTSGQGTDKIAFSRDGAIALMNPDGTGVQPLTNTNMGAGELSQSPDGSKIAFFSNVDGDGEIYVLQKNVTTGQWTGPVQLTFNSAIDKQPEFSPDGTKIVFAS